MSFYWNFHKNVNNFSKWTIDRKLNQKNTNIQRNLFILEQIFIKEKRTIFLQDVFSLKTFARVLRYFFIIEGDIFKFIKEIPFFIKIEYILSQKIMNNIKIEEKQWNIEEKA